MSPDAPRDNRAHVWHRVKSKGGGQLCPQMHRGTTCPIRPCKPLHACSALHRAAARRAGGGGRRLVVVVWMHAAPGAPRKFPAPCSHLRLGGTLSISPKCKKGGGGAYPPWDFLGFRKRVACCSARAHEKKRGISQLFFRRRIAFALISTKRAGRFSSWIPGRQPAKKVRKVPAAQRPRSATA